MGVRAPEELRDLRASPALQGGEILSHTDHDLAGAAGADPLHRVESGRPALASVFEFSSPNLDGPHVAEGDGVGSRELGCLAGLDAALELLSRRVEVAAVPQCTRGFVGKAGLAKEENSTGLGFGIIGGRESVLRA